MTDRDNAENWIVELGKQQIRNDPRFAGMSEDRISATVNTFFADRGPGATTDWNVYLDQTHEFLASLAATAQATADAEEADRVAAAGAVRTRVRRLQTMLKDAGFFTGSINDRVYTEETATAVAKFRTDVLSMDGTFSVGSKGAMKWLNAEETSILKTWGERVTTAEETEDWLATDEARLFLGGTEAVRPTDAEVLEWLDTDEARLWLGLPTKAQEEATAAAEAAAAAAEAAAEEAAKAAEEAAAAAAAAAAEAAEEAARLAAEEAERIAREAEEEAQRLADEAAQAQADAEAQAAIDEANRIAAEEAAAAVEEAARIADEEAAAAAALELEQDFQDDPMLGGDAAGGENIEDLPNAPG